MSTPEPTAAPTREFGRTLNAIRTVVRRMTALLEDLEKEGKALDQAGQPAQALVVSHTVIALRVVMRGLSEVFRIAV